jgi:hypothetical protein
MRQASRSFVLTKRKMVSRASSCADKARGKHSFRTGEEVSLPMRDDSYA